MAETKTGSVAVLGPAAGPEFALENLLENPLEFFWNLPAKMARENLLKRIQALPGPGISISGAFP